MTKRRGKGVDREYQAMQRALCEVVMLADANLLDREFAPLHANMLLDARDAELKRMGCRVRIEPIPTRRKSK